MTRFTYGKEYFIYMLNYSHFSLNRRRPLRGVGLAVDNPEQLSAVLRLYPWRGRGRGGSVKAPGSRGILPTLIFISNELTPSDTQVTQDGMPDLWR